LNSYQFLESIGKPALHNIVLYPKKWNMGLIYQHCLCAI
jgi:hypothetical protein